MTEGACATVNICHSSFSWKPASSQQSRCILKLTRSAPPNDACLLPVRGVKLSVNITVSLHGDLWCSRAWVNYSLAQLKCIRVPWLPHCQSGCPCRAFVQDSSRSPPPLTRTRPPCLSHTFLPLPSSIHGLDCAAVDTHTHTHTHSPTEHRFLSSSLVSVLFFFFIYIYISKHLMLLQFQKGRKGGRGQLIPDVRWFEYSVYAQMESGFMGIFSSYQLMWCILIKLVGKNYTISIYLKWEGSCK